MPHAVSVCFRAIKGESAQIALGFETPDNEFIDLKNYDVNPDRAPYSWTSNNSIYTELGQVHNHIAERIALNGEPGIVLTENLKNYGRMCDEKLEYPDGRGLNPCAEITLEPYELCNLVEVFPYHHDTYEEFEESLRQAFLFAKSITLTTSHWNETNEVMMKNRRVGVSLSGIVQAIDKFGLNTFKHWCDDGYRFLKKYDREISNQLCIPLSRKITTVKPSGTVSLLAGASPGVHFPHSKYYIRRVRIAKNHILLKPVTDAGYPVEDCVYDKATAIISFPIKYEGNVSTIDEVTMYDQLNITSFMQKYWADNMVSSTVTFDPKVVSANEIARALDMYQHQLKVISMLPKTEEGAYPQMPYEACTEEVYEKMMVNIKPLDFSFLYAHQKVFEETEENEEDEFTYVLPHEETFCSNGQCEMIVKQESPYN